MQAAGAETIHVFPTLHYNGWHGTPTELKNRLLSIIDFSESAYYGDVAANVLDLALGAPTTPRSSTHFLANLQFSRLKAIYANDPFQYRRVLALDKRLLQQVEMRYQVFFSAMAGQLDGTLDYANADAVYLRVRGFTLRNEAPRLGRFLISDFMHYIAERRRSGVQTLLIIDEFNALRMREETSILFEQVRSFGGNLMISAQGYAGLGPPNMRSAFLTPARPIFCMPVAIQAQFQSVQGNASFSRHPGQKMRKAYHVSMFVRNGTGGCQRVASFSKRRGRHSGFIMVVRSMCRRRWFRLRRNKLRMAGRRYVDRKRCSDNCWRRGPAPECTNKVLNKLNRHCQYNHDQKLYHRRRLLEKPVHQSYKRRR